MGIYIGTYIISSDTNFSTKTIISKVVHFYNQIGT